MKLLVTGGAGFIGSAVCRQAIADGDEVVNLDNFGYAATSGSTVTLADNPAYAFIKADIKDRGALDRIFSENRPDAVIHLAAESHVDRSINNPEAFVQTNVVGTLNLLQASLAYFCRIDSEAQERFRFLHVSTDEVYGSLGPEGLFREDTVYDPRSPYSASKAASDHLVSAWRHTFKLPTLISNCSNNYGPFQFPEKLISLTIINALEGSPLPVYGDGGNIRDWLYVHDHVRALLRILRRGEVGQTYNIGGRNERTNLSVVHTICDCLDDLRPLAASRRSLIRFVEDRPGHDRRYAVDATKLETDLGWSAEETFDTGIAKTIEWYLANESWWRPLRARYFGERLGLNAT